MQHSGWHLIDNVIWAKVVDSRYGSVNVVLKNDNGDFVRRLVHELVAETFLPNPDGKTKVRHKDGKKKNNSAANLEWCD
jgi:hypothetical protein